MTAAPPITLADGTAALTRFMLDMPLLGYVIHPFPLDDQLDDRKVLAPEGLPAVRPALYMRSRLQKDFSPTALYMRLQADFTVLNPHIRPGNPGAYWLAEVKGEAVGIDPRTGEPWENTSLEAVQLLENYVLATRLGVDVRYLYVPDTGPMRWCSAVEVVEGGSRAMFAYPNHPSNPEAERLLKRLRLAWPRRVAHKYYDPFTTVPPFERGRWRVLTAAEKQEGAEPNELMPWDEMAGDDDPDAWDWTAGWVER